MIIRVQRVLVHERTGERHTMTSAPLPAALTRTDEECHVLLIERKTTKHTGDVTTEKTRSIDEQLRPV